jgi:hypothetical protein
MIVYSNIPTVTDGGQQEAIVSDWDDQRLLTHILKEMKFEGTLNAKLEVIAGDTYIVPWEDTIKVESPVVVEARVKDIKSEKKTLSIDVKKVDEKTVKMEEPKKTVRVKSRFGKLLEK